MKRKRTIALATEEEIAKAGTEIRAQADARGLSLNKFATLIGVGQGTLHAIVNRANHAKKDSVSTALLGRIRTGMSVLPPAQKPLAKAVSADVNCAVQLMIEAGLPTLSLEQLVSLSAAVVAEIQRRAQR